MSATSPSRMTDSVVSACSRKRISAASAIRTLLPNMESVTSAADSGIAALLDRLRKNDDRRSIRRTPAWCPEHLKLEATQVGDELQGLVGNLHDLTVEFVDSLCRDEVDDFAHWLDVRGFEVALAQRPETILAGRRDEWRAGADAV